MIFRVKVTVDIRMSRNFTEPDTFTFCTVPLGDISHKLRFIAFKHYNDVIMGAIASQITSLTIVYSKVYPGADQRKHERSASLAFVQGIHRGPVNSPHKWSVTRKMFPFDDVIMKGYRVWHFFGANNSNGRYSKKNTTMVYKNDIRIKIPDSLSHCLLLARLRASGLDTCACDFMDT